MMPLVSVVLPTYNRPTELKRSLLSLSEQTYRPLEVVVVDDHSETPAAAVVSDLNVDIDVTCIRHEKNKGANAARNTGIRLASGDLIAFLDDDDEWTPEKIERQVDAFAATDSDVGVVYASIQNVYPDGSTTMSRAAHGGALTKKLLFQNVVGTFSTVLVRRDCIEKTGLLDERFPSWQDKEWYIRLSQNCSFEPIGDRLVLHHHETANRISADFSTLVSETYPLFVEKFSPLARSYGRVFYRRWRSAVAYNVAMYALNVERYRSARRFLFASLRWYPVSLRSLVHLPLTIDAVATHWNSR